jgi:hypothetical protein
MKDVGEGAAKKFAARRLDNIGTIKPHSGVVNNVDCGYRNNRESCNFEEEEEEEG